MKIGMAMGGVGRVGSGQVTPIPTLLCLFKIILIPIPFKKLNKVDWYDKFPYPHLSRLTFFLNFIFFKLFLKFLITLK